jgi:cellulose synthase/poly-beta-1,6-N-acetylglucosamine synthase-like glycosyltransferase
MARSQAREIVLPDRPREPIRPFERVLTHVDGEPTQLRHRREATVRPRLGPVPEHRLRPGPLHPQGGVGTRATSLLIADIDAMQNRVVTLTGEIADLRATMGTLAVQAERARTWVDLAEAAAPPARSPAPTAVALADEPGPVTVDQILVEAENELARWEAPHLVPPPATSVATAAPVLEPELIDRRLHELKARVATLRAAVPAAAAPPAPAIPAAPRARAATHSQPARRSAPFAPSRAAAALSHPAAPTVQPRRARPGAPVKREMARELLTRGQIVAAASCGAIIVAGVVVAPVPALRVLILAVVLFWTLLLGLKARLAIASKTTYEHRRAADPADADLPSFTVLVPLYREANMVRGLRDALGRLHYPGELLQVLLLLEADDEETIAAAVQHGVAYLVVPEGGPKNKPNALNFGLAQATGDYTVIYDAEDRPEPDQLLKFVGTFRDTSEKVACVQARLMFWNGASSWVSRFYWVEYVIHFEWVLRGLARMGLVPPLGGTSNCFRTSVLLDVAFAPGEMPFQDAYIGAWDPWNVTEDADLAGALALRGLDVVMTDSVTYEEATASLRIALGQRSRWLKGYLHTGLVYTRHPITMSRAMSLRRYAVYVLLMLGTPLSILLTPVFWGLTVAYFITRSTFIESLYPAPVLYLGVALMLAGNLFLFYQRVWACVHRRSDGGVKYMLLSPIWELFGVVVLVRVANELCRKSLRHRWVKTEHGHDTVTDDQGAALVHV